MWGFEPEQPLRVWMWMYECMSVHCRKVAGHRRLWNFPVKPQYDSIGCLGLVVLFFFLLPVAFQFHFHLWVQEEGGEVGKCCKTPPGCWRSQAVPMTGGTPQCWVRFPGRGAWGHGDGKPSHLGQLWLQGAPSMCCSSSQKFDLFFERTGEIINHSWWRQSWSD